MGSVRLFYDAVVAMAVLVVCAVDKESGSAPVSLQKFLQKHAGRQVLAIAAD